MSIDEVNERSIKVINVAFTDENGDPVIPSTAFYRIDDVGSGTEIREETEITSLAENVDIVLEDTDTVILNEHRPYETRRVTISWTYSASPGIDGYGNEQYLLNVKNLKGVTAPSPA